MLGEKRMANQKKVCTQRTHTQRIEFNLYNYNAQEGRYCLGGDPGDVGGPIPMPAAQRPNTSPVLSHACLSSLYNPSSGKGVNGLVLLELLIDDVRRSDAPGMSIGAM